MDEDQLRRDIREALDAVSRPAPGLLGSAMGRVRAVSTRGRLRMRSWALQVGATLLAVIVFGALAIVLHHERIGPAPVPSMPLPGAVPRLEPGAQVAWLTSGVGIDQAGRILGPIDGADAIRSPDGTRLYAIVGKAIVVYSALTGQKEGTLVEVTAPFVATQIRLSSDGHYLGLLEFSSTHAVAVEMIDLQAGRSVARLDLGLSSPGGAGLLMLAPNARTLYVFSDLSLPSTVAVLSFDGASLRITDRVSNGAGGHTVPDCSGLFTPYWLPGGLPIELLPDGQTLAAYCPMDGRIFWFDLTRLTVVAQLRAYLPNPFWLSPVFSPDGTMLYLHEGFSGQGGVQAVDLVQRKIVKSTNRLGQLMSPLRWLVERLVTPVYAGGTLRTAAVSPDGSWLYLIAEGGVHAYHLPELSQKAVWLPSPTVWFSGDGPSAAVWVSGDSRTVYVLGRDERIYIVRAADGALVASTPASRPISGDFLVFGS